MARPVRHPQPRVPAILSQPIVTLTRTDDLTPLQYMISVMNDRTADRKRRDRMACAAAPYCHARIADHRKGAKDLKAEAADNAGAGSAWEEDLQPERLSAAVMLDRPARRERHAIRMRRHRQRQAAGRMAVTVEVGAELVDLMVRTGWLPPRDCHTRDQIARALSAMVADAAKIS